MLAREPKAELCRAVMLRLCQLVQGYMNLKLGVDKVYAEMEEDYDDDIGEVSLEEAIEIIQRNERGRQGKLRAGLVKRLRTEELRQRCVWDIECRCIH